jgi:hypothetical protein
MPENTLARQAMLQSWRCFFDGCTDNWAARVHKFFQLADIHRVTSLPADPRIPVYAENVVLRKLKQLCHQAYLLPALPTKMAAYHTDFACAFDANVMRHGWNRPAYFALPMSLHKLRLLARFRLSCHHLAVETGRWSGIDIDQRVCTLCQSGAVQDEHHILFVCPALLATRNKYPALFTGRFTHVRQLFDSSHLHDWKLVVRDLCRFLLDVGGIYQPLSLPALQPALPPP